MLHIAYKYGDADSIGARPSVSPVERTLLASANAGGENVARGALLGALVGARYGLQGIPSSLRNGLLQAADIDKETAAFADTFLPDSACKSEF